MIVYELCNLVSILLRVLHTTDHTQSDYFLFAISLQPKPPSTTDLEPLLEGLLRPPEKLAVLYPGCSEETRVVVNVADSMLFNVTMVRT